MLRTLKRLTRPMRGQVARAIYNAPPPTFDHVKAQRYELFHAAVSVGADFPRLFAAVQEERSRGGLWHGACDPWFRGDEAMWAAFVDHVRPRKCLEVGSGPFGYLAPCWWIKQRIMIDPLIDAYRSLQLESCGATLYSDVETFSEPAESRIESLIGRVDGAIICRNALDHCEDPLAVLMNISAYAAGGCYLLLWTDLWHNDGCDDGHRNITRSPEVMDGLLRGLGFSIIQHSDEVRHDAGYIEYGALARKLPD